MGFKKGHVYYGGKGVGFQKGHPCFGGFETRIKSGEHLSSATEFKKGGCRGKMNKNWKGGKKMKNLVVGDYYRWKAWKEELLKRDNFTCQFCGKKETLEAHHVFHKSLFPGLAYNKNNGIIMCEECHKEHHMLMGKIRGGEKNVS